ncbi:MULTISPECIES: LysR family transcriptional regulator [Nonomuraea]|uniref:LysR family transcriptional regulator n=1 Tax=Nonomuraea mangrovi TaxID=2316207 RepID=A0ABW4TE46_9ACTN
MLDVRRLRILQHLDTYGTVAATAEALHLTAPAVSQQLAVLEREAGVPVVEKHGRTLRLTPAGELLVAHAEVVLGDLAAAESDLAALRGGRHGLVRVAAFASAARTLVPAVWQRLADGSLTLQLVEQEPEDALEALRKRETDLAIVHGYTVLPRRFPAGCEQATLMEDPVLLALHPDHAGRLGVPEGEAVDLARLADASWLTPGPEASCYEMIQRTCGAAGFVPAIRARSSDFSVLTALVAAGAGVALVPRLALPAASAPISLHPLVRPVSRTIFTVSRAGTARRPDIRRLVTLLQEAAADVGQATTGPWNEAGRPPAALRTCDPQAL